MNNNDSESNDDLYLHLENQTGEERSHQEQMKMWEDVNIVLRKYQYFIRGISTFQGICKYADGVRKIIQECKDLENNA